MNFISLFSGVGGFDLGFERAGMACVAQVEIDAKCREVLAEHWPDVTRYEDVRTVSFERGTVDLICGGFPCQDLSVAGRRAGLAGERSGLWHEFRRILAETRPAWAVIENVPGLLSSNGGRDFAIVLRGLVECGYGVAWRILDAQYFGVAQRRRRVFIVGHLGDGRAAQVLFESQTDSNAECGQGKTSEIVSNCVEASGFRGSQSGNGFTYVHDTGGVRMFSPVECCRLQGFPDDWNEGQSDSTRYKQMGNAVCVPVAEWIGRRIVQVTR